MKIDLRKDRGLLGSVKFQATSSPNEELSEDEQIAETMRRRRSAKLSKHTDEPIDPELSNEPASTERTPQSKKNVKRISLRELLIFIVMLASFTYYLYDKGELFSSIDKAKSYVMNLVGMPIVASNDLDVAEDTLDPDGILPESLFNALMPVTSHIAALADSIAKLNDEALFVDSKDSSDSSEYDYVYIPVIEKQVILSDDDLSIINNRSLLLLVTELIDVYPAESGAGHLFLKRDALKLTAPRRGEWVGQVKSTLDKFVSGSFIEDYSSGKAVLTSKFELILYTEQDFQPQILSALKLLDVLAHPFNDYLKQIIIDLPRGVDENPAKFTFAGSIQEIQYILSSWAESRNNIRLTSIDIDFQGDELTLTIGAIFFTYKP